MKNNWIAYAMVFALCFFLGTEYAKAQVQAQEDTAITGREVIGQTGQMFTIQYYPANRRFIVGMVGKTIAQYDPNGLVILAKTFAREGKAQNLNVVYNNKYFQILDPFELKNPLEIQVKDPRTRKTETFHLKLGPLN